MNRGEDEMNRGDRERLTGEQIVKVLKAKGMAVTAGRVRSARSAGIISSIRDGKSILSLEEEVITWALCGAPVEPVELAPVKETAHRPVRELGNVRLVAELSFQSWDEVASRLRAMSARARTANAANDRLRVKLLQAEARISELEAGDAFVRVTRTKKRLEKEAKL